MKKGPNGGDTPEQRGPTSGVCEHHELVATWAQRADQDTMRTLAALRELEHRIDIRLDNLSAAQCELFRIINGIMDIVVHTQALTEDIRMRMAARGGVDE